MRIVFLRAGYGKPDSRMEKEVATAIEAGHTVRILAWDRSAGSDVEHKIEVLSQNVECVHIGVKSELSAGFKRNLLPMIRFNCRLIKYLLRDREKFDLIHASDFDTVLPAYYIKKRYHKKLLYDIYDYYSDSHHMPTIIKKVIKKVDTRIMNDSDAVIICNEKRKEQIQPANPKKLIIVHNSPEFELINNKVQKLPPKNKFRIVFIGGIARTGRYIFEMIDVIKERDDCELIIGGFGAGEKEIQALSEKYDNIYFVGKQNYENVLSIETTADMLTALYDPSLVNHRYAAPNKFYEALMLGKPLVCVKNTNIDEIIAEAKLGWVLNVPQEDFGKAFHQAIDSAIKSKGDFDNISSRAKRLFQEKYDWKIMKKRLIETYKNI